MTKFYLPILLNVLILIACNNTYGQRDNIWQLGNFVSSTIPGFGLDFSNNSPDTFSVSRIMPFFNTNSSICDTNGNLLFYNNGIFIGNSLHDTLSNSQNFNPGGATNYFSSMGLNMPQASIILPFPGSDSIYCIFHESAEFFTANNMNEQQPLNLRYSLIDMTLDNNQGGIIANKKGIVILNDTLSYGKISACNHGNGRDWWVIAHKYYSDIFYKVLLTPDSIFTSFQQIGSQIIYDAGGQSVFSLDGTKYAFLTQNHLLDLYDFDRCTGQLSNHVAISVPDTLYGALGCSISPNNEFLYVGNQIKIYQYDLLSPNIANSVVVVAEWDTVASPLATLFFLHQIAPDGKIYIGTFNGCDILHVIDNPNNQGLSCNVIQNSVKLPGNNFSLPNFPNYNLGAMTGSPCDTLVGIQEQENSIFTNSELFIYYSPEWQAAFINAKNLTGKNFRLEIFDSLGKKVHSQTGSLTSSYYTKNLNCEMFAIGMYIVKLETEKERLVKRFIKE